MRPVRLTLIYFLIYAIFIMLWSYMLYGCSAERLHQKAIQKGYTHTLKVDTIKVASIDTMWIEGKPYPVINYRDSLIYQIETEYIPKWRYRFDSKRFADSLAHIRAMYEDSLRNALKSLKIKSAENKQIVKQKTKKTKSQNKNTFADAMKWVALSIFGIIILVIIFLVLRAVKRHIFING